MARQEKKRPMRSRNSSRRAIYRRQARLTRKRFGGFAAQSASVAFSRSLAYVVAVTRLSFCVRARQLLFARDPRELRFAADDYPHRRKAIDRQSVGIRAGEL